ncbi:MAG: DNA translocase FtsK [Planctomycetia bacterium]|nr:DNA translocase FtsK [Planctomycetia bacterium]
MLQERSVKLDLFAIALAACTVFLALTLFTYSPADPPSMHVYPQSPVPTNACGKLGAWTAFLLLEGLGLGAYYIALSLGVLAAVLLQGKRVEQPWVRAGGWSLSLLGFATVVQLLAPGMSPGPIIGSGGYVGAMGRAFLEAHFALTGSLILLLGVVSGGLLLCTDYVLLRISAAIFGAPVRQMSRGLAKGADALAERRKRTVAAQLRTDIAPLPIEPTEMAIKIGGKKLSRVEDEVADEEEVEDDEEVEELDAEEEAEIEAMTVAPVAAVAPPTKTEPAKTVAAESAGPRVRTQNSKKNEREAMMAELDKAANITEERPEFELPPIDLLVKGVPFNTDEQEKDVRKKAKQLEKTFANFGFNVKVVEIETGPVIAQFELELEAGLRLSKISSLADDVAIALRVPSVRIVAPIPGKNTVGIEVPNAERQTVMLREVIEEGAAKAAKMTIPIYLGKDVAGNPLLADMAKLPHLLIAGRTGTGKSVCLNTLIMSMLMTRRPDELRMLLIDPKMVEFSCYKTLPHLMHPVVTDMKKAEAILAWAVEKMEERYALLARAGVRQIANYNQLGEEELMERLQPESDEERKNIPQHLPYIVIVADEMADLLMQQSGKDVEAHIIRLAQKSRAVGIHLVLATQKPTVDVITGLIKSNLPARIAFQVASRTDSRVVLDEMGADKLLGNGDMLFLSPGTSTLLRGQGTYVSDDEINKVVEFVSTTEPDFVKELVSLKPAGADAEKGADHWKSRDELYEAAIDVIVREGRGSVSLLQRALGVGYGRGARLIDFMAEDGIVGPYNGSQAREVLLTVEEWESLYKGNTVTPRQPTASASKSAKRGPIKPDVIVEQEDEAETDEYEDDSEEAAETDAFAAAEDAEDEWEEAEDDSDDDESTGNGRRSRTA